MNDTTVDEFEARAPREDDRRDRVLRVLSALAPWAVLSVLALVLAAFWWPGSISDDTYYYMDEAATKVFSNHHAPIMNWIWSWVWPYGIGPGWVLTMQFAGFLYGAYLIARSLFSRWWSVLVAALFAIAPQGFGLLGYVGRDLWFLVAVTLMFGLVLAALDRRGWQAHLLRAGVVFFAFFALASRQNAAPAVWLPLALAAWPYLRSIGAIERRGAFLRTIAALAASGMLMLAMVGTQSAIKDHIVSRDNYPQAWLFLFDLGAMSLEEDELLIPKSLMREPTLAAVRRTFNYDMYLHMTLGPDAPVPVPFPPKPEQAALIQSTWEEEVRDRPGVWMTVKWKEFLRQISLTARPIGTHGDGVMESPRGYESRFPSLVNASIDYMETFDNHAIGQLLFRTWIYLLVGLGCAIFLLVRHGRDLVCLTFAAMVGAGWLYQSGLFFGAMGTNWRFEQGPVLWTMFAALATVVMIVRDRREDQPRVASSRTATPPIG